MNFKREIRPDQITNELFISELGFDFRVLGASLEKPPLVVLTSCGRIADASRANAPFIDAALFYPLALTLSPTAVRCFFVLLSLLERNDRPILLTIRHLKTMIGESRKMMKANNAMRELQINKLIFRHKGDYNNYYINPLFVWKGDRTAYFDPATLPFSWNA